jgi:general L-amino acid transport system substrate-binding protein
LKDVLVRGQLICGVNEAVFGFGFLNPNTGELTGIYVDFCRALAAATIGEADAVDFRLQAMNASATSVIDDGLDILLNHELSPTLSGLAHSELATSPVVVFYDGTSLMVVEGGAISAWEDLNSETICTLNDSRSATDFAMEMKRRQLTYDEDSLLTIADMSEAFFSGRCGALVLERSLLEIIRQSNPNPAAFVVWGDPFTRQPISPIVAYGDKQWADIVTWTLHGLIQAERFGVTSESIDRFLRVENESDLDYRRRVGEQVAAMLDPGLGIGYLLGLENDFMAGVIRQIGNYGEIYDRHLGPASLLPIERGLNALWSDGGLLYAPDWR